MKIGLVTLYDEHIAAYGDITAENKRRYCERHGYRFYHYKAKIFDGLHPSWSKLAALNRAWEDNDWLFWSDADAIIVNDAVRLEQWVRPEYHMIVSTDWHGLNFGNFLIQNCDWSKDLLGQVYAGRRTIDFFWEQSALIRLVAANVTVRARIHLAGSAFNSRYSDPAWDFLLHLSGLRDDMRLAVIRELGPAPAGAMGFERIRETIARWIGSVPEEDICPGERVPYEAFEVARLLQRSAPTGTGKPCWMPPDGEWMASHVGAAAQGGIA
jgi:hypothetical protein